jgi:predicted Zn-dependent protease with MMP-like domain
VPFPPPKKMTDEEFSALVEAAYKTLPEDVRSLEDFPGISILDEPPESILKTKGFPPGTEMLGCFSGLTRAKQSWSIVEGSPRLIFVFKGPIERCSNGNLPEEIKRVVWHEVAHWLGHTTEKEVRELGL